MNKTPGALTQPPLPDQRRLAALDRQLARLMAAPPGARALAVALLLSAPILWLMATAPNAALTYTYHDAFIPLDAAWRVLQGQWPHLDFYSPLGVMYAWLHAAAAWLWGLDGRVLIRANLLVLPGLAIPAIVLAWRRLASLPAVTLVLLVVLLVVGPAFIDGPGSRIAHLANYNRIGWAACSLVCLWALGQARRSSRGWDLAEALWVGLALLALAYLKLTFLAAALGTILVGCLLRRRLWNHAAVALAVLLAGVAALELLRPGLLSAYLADLQRARRVHEAVLRPGFLKEALATDVRLVGLLAALAALTAWLLPTRRLAVAGVLVIAMGCLLVASQNFGAFSPPLVVLVMLLVQWLAGDATHEPRGAASGGFAMSGGVATSGNAAPGVASGDVASGGVASGDVASGGVASYGVASDGGGAMSFGLRTAGLAALGVAALPFLFTQANGTLDHALLARKPGGLIDGGRSETFRTLRWHRHWRDHLPENFTIAEAHRIGLVVPPETMGAALADGFELIERQRPSAHPRIATLSFSNPFPAALREPPPRGVALWWDRGRTYDRATLTAAEAIGDADMVMVPKIWRSYRFVEDLARAARPALERDFTPHESAYWTAWVRKP